MWQCVKLVSENYLFLMTKPAENPHFNVYASHTVYGVLGNPVMFLYHLLNPYIEPKLMRTLNFFMHPKVSEAQLP